MKKGFTLLEILLVVGIIAILAGIVIVALNPTKQFATVRNTQRKSNLAELNKALYQYYIDNSSYPTSVPTTNLGEICNTGATSTGHSISCTGYVDLSSLVPTYLTAIPTDPQASGTSTGYLVAKNTANKIYVKASNAELSQTVALGPADGILPDHLVSYWSFDGNANDSQGTNHGTVSGAVATTGIRSISNTAYTFNGTNSDRINLGSPTSLSVGTGDWSASVWINPIDLAVNKGVFIFDNDGVVICNSNRVGILQDGNCQVYTSVVSLNQWTHIIATRTGTVYKLYKNGIEDYSSVQNSSWGLSSQYYIGKGYMTNYFTGSVDNVRFYNKALSAEEVLTIYNTEKP